MNQNRPYNFGDTIRDVTQLFVSIICKNSAKRAVPSKVDLEPKIISFCLLLVNATLIRRQSRSRSPTFAIKAVSPILRASEPRNTYVLRLVRPHKGHEHAIFIASLEFINGMYCNVRTMF